MKYNFNCFMFNNIIYVFQAKTSDRTSSEFMENAIPQTATQYGASNYTPCQRLDSQTGNKSF